MFNACFTTHLGAGMGPSIRDGKDETAHGEEVGMESQLPLMRVQYVFNASLIRV